MNEVNNLQLKTLFLSGLPNDNRGNVVINAKGETNILLSGSSNLSNFLGDLPGVSYNFFFSRVWTGSTISNSILAEGYC
jgi:hypothetical protein